MASERARWGSRLGFILAAAGSAVGLGNIWKFPYITGENGGGLFVIIYLVCIALVGIPIMMSEIMIGRAAQAQPVVAFETLQGRKTAWAGVGWLGVVAGFVILSYYIVVAGWAMDFTLKSVVNITEPIHDTAEVQGSTYRATTSTEDMLVTLVTRKAEKDLKYPIKQIKNGAPPSVWKEYERYTAALAGAGVQDEIHADLLRRLWRGESAAVLGAVGRTADGQPLPEEEAEVAVPADEEDAETEQAPALSFQDVRERLFEDPDFAAQIAQAESLMEEVEALRKTGLLEAKEYHDGKTEVEIHDEAEAVHRRSVIFQKVDETFSAVKVDGWTSSFWSTVFMLLVILIVAGGISSGIERTCRILMPTLIILILVMVVYGAFKEGFGEAVLFVFKPDPSKLKPSGVLEALGHAFFTLSLGMGAMITYGSYQQTKKNLVGQSVAIAVLDTAIALLACLMIFPIIFTYDQEAAAGPGLVFKSMPLAFAEIGKGGMLLAILFFGLLVFAAITSAISLLEVVASYFIDQLGWNRRKAAWSLGGIILAFALGSAFASDPDFMLDSWAPSFGSNFFDTLDYLATNWMLPTGGLFIALYAGWALPRRLRNAELSDVAGPIAMIWLLLVRFIAPALVIVVLLQKVGILDADELLHGLFN
ncbi:MAG: sodium-dependent transporter [Phycisphaerales bacterium]|nr:MAG: sodium-dependent transporter [Phycisphaerales bacterium]